MVLFLFFVGCFVEFDVFCFFLIIGIGIIGGDDFLLMGVVCVIFMVMLLEFVLFVFFFLFEFFFVCLICLYIMMVVIMVMM